MLVRVIAPARRQPRGPHVKRVKLCINLVDLVGGINLDLLNWACKVVSVLLKWVGKWYWYCSTWPRCFGSHEVETHKENQSAVRVSN